MRRTFIAIALTALAFIPSAQAQQPIWGPTVEADNGQQYRLANINQYPGGMVEVFVVALGAPGEGSSLPERIWFDCRGHMKNVSPYNTPMAYFPPRSVAARISELACAEAKEKKPLDVIVPHLVR